MEIHPSPFSVTSHFVRYHVNGPRTVIGANTDLKPGQCWPMLGSQGHLLIKLSHRVFLTGFSLEHISKTASPTNNIASAPKDFEVEAFGDDAVNENPTRLGPFRYDGIEALQHYTLNFTNSDRITENTTASFVKLKILSNHGHSEYTCIYRFRVHGSYAGN